MAFVADSGGLYALYDADDAHHAGAVAAVENEPGVIYIPMAVLAEVDYLLRAHLGIDAELAFLEDISNGAYLLQSLEEDDVHRCRKIFEQYRDLDLGLADAAVVATAERLSIQRIPTVDQRHFRAVIPESGIPFILLPADA
jgi:predicted nucleic acid-binding protein